jgi:hypothetical protein
MCDCDGCSCGTIPLATCRYPWWEIERRMRTHTKAGGGKEGRRVRRGKRVFTSSPGVLAEGPGRRAGEETSELNSIIAIACNQDIESSPSCSESWQTLLPRRSSSRTGRGTHPLDAAPSGAARKAPARLREARSQRSSQLANRKVSLGCFVVCTNQPQEMRRDPNTMSATEVIDS